MTAQPDFELDSFQPADIDPCETWTLARDTLAPQDPIRVFLEEGNPEALSYTMREGAFPDEDAARHWLDHRDGPLPQPPEDRSDAAAMRARVALTRSAGPAATATARGPGSAPYPGRGQRPGSGRSL